MDSYNILKVIGSGTYASASLIKHKKTQEERVVKIIHNETRLDIDMAEVEILKELSNPHVTRYFDHFLEDKQLHIIMEFCTGPDLNKYIKNCIKENAHVPEVQIMKWFTQLCIATDHIHSKHIIHRDIKLQNIFITCGENVLKLGDFGVSRKFNSTNSVGSDYAGTVSFCSPEMLRDNGERTYNNKTDIWSLACVLYNIVTLKPLFEESNIVKLIEEQKNPNYDFNPSRAMDAEDIIKEMLTFLPCHRPTAEELLEKDSIKIHRQQIEEFNKRANLTPEERKKLNNDLVRAAEYGRTKRVDQLLKDGADINYQNCLGECALWCAAYFGRVEVTELLLQQPGVHLHLKDYRGYTPLGIARRWSTHTYVSEDKRRGCSQVAKLLVDHGATE